MIIKNPLTVIKGSGGIPWNIRASAIAPTGQGNAGDIVVLTDLDVTSIKTVSNINLAYDRLELNSINLISSSDGVECRLLNFNKYNFGGKFNASVVNVSGENKATIVYVWDTLTNAWISYAPLFIDVVSFVSFMGADIIVPDYFGVNGFNVTDDAVVVSVVPIISNPTDSLTLTSFMGADIVVPDYFGVNGFNVTESPVITSGGGGQVYP